MRGGGCPCLSRKWVHLSSFATHAKVCPLDASIQILLQQRRDRLLHLKPRWINTLASGSRFDAHVERAKNHAQGIFAVAVPLSQPLTWMNLTTFETGDKAVDNNDITDPIHDHNTAIDEEVIFLDFLGDDAAEDEPLAATKSDVMLIWSVPVCELFDSTAYDCLLSPSIARRQTSALMGAC